jgi:lipopolysaccharide assembly outer membrane protein LptD (OstA)
MKFLALSALAACQVFTFAPQARCQDNKAQPEQLHLTIAVPQENGDRVKLTASSMQRDLSSKENASIIQLKGNVEIITMSCIPSTRSTPLVCRGEMALHADEADYNEKTGEINARGNVHITQHPEIRR